MSNKNTTRLKPLITTVRSPEMADQRWCFQSGSRLATILHSIALDSVQAANTVFSATVTARVSKGKSKTKGKSTTSAHP